VEVEETGTGPHDLGLDRVAITCTECTLVFSSLLALYNTLPLKLVEKTAIDICIEADLFPADVCEGMVGNSAEEVLFVLNNTQHGLHSACTMFFNVCDSPLPDWEMEVPAGKPDVLPRLPNDGPKTIRVLHFTDTHVDKLYSEGSLAVCEHPRCCRESVNNDSYPGDAMLCGRYGNEAGSCDMPQRSFEAALAAASELSPDMVYFTGDIPAHDVWLQSHDSNVQDLRDTTDLFKAYFPDIPIVYSLGNHEAAPVNSFPVPSVYDDGYTLDYLYSVLPEVWGAGGLPEDALDTVAAGGYYSWLVQPGLRVVALNTNYGNSENWWMLMEHVDPTGQLAWLTEVLTEAERHGERVHLLHHHSPGSVLSSFSAALNRLLTRFENTVVGIFVGHSHQDHFKILFDVDNNTRPVGVTYIAPSIISDGLKSPSFRIYELDGGYDGATWEVVDTHTYSMNLTLANQGAEPEFPLAYSAKEAYSIADLSPETWAALAWDMASDDDLLYEFFKHYRSFLLEPLQDWEDCDDPCRASFLASFYSSNAADGQPAERIQAEYYAAHPAPEGRV